MIAVSGTHTPRPIATSCLAISGGTCACVIPVVAKAIATSHNILRTDLTGTSSSNRVYRNGSYCGRELKLASDCQEHAPPAEGRSVYLRLSGWWTERSDDAQEPFAP